MLLVKTPTSASVTSQAATRPYLWLTASYTHSSALIIPMSSMSIVADVNYCPASAMGGKRTLAPASDHRGANKCGRDKRSDHEEA